ncbi:MAG: aspartyl protease family protein [Phycisphaerae bacterium]|nr:aspartyl protease family protein [Phycisphaerae bacterium]
MNKRTLIVGLIVGLMGVLLCSSAWAAGPKVIERFKLSAGGAPIVVPVTIGGKTYSFLLDTGSARTTFDESLRPLLGEPKDTVELQTPDKKKHTISTYYAPDAMLGKKISLKRGGLVMCVDLSKAREVTGLDIRGIVGMGLLRRYVLRLRFDDGVLEFLESGVTKVDDTSSSVANAHPEWGRAIEIRTGRGGVPYMLAALFDRYKGKFVIDSGYSGTGVLSPKVFDELVKEKRITATAACLITSTTGNIESLRGRVGKLTVAGGFEYKNLIFDKGRGQANFLGLEFLARHTVTLDFPNLMLYLKKGKNFDRPDEGDMSGLHLLHKTLAGGKSTVVVHSADKGSPAAQVGLIADDILLKFNGQSLEGYTMTAIRNLLRSKEGREIEVTLRRGGTDYSVKFKLKKKI